MPTRSHVAASSTPRTTGDDGAATAFVRGPVRKPGDRFPAARQRASRVGRGTWRTPAAPLQARSYWAWASYPWPRDPPNQRFDLQTSRVCLCSTLPRMPAACQASEVVRICNLRRVAVLAHSPARRPLISMALRFIDNCKYAPKLLDCEFGKRIRALPFTGSIAVTDYWPRNGKFCADHNCSADWACCILCAVDGTRRPDRSGGILTSARAQTDRHVAGGLARNQEPTLPANAERFRDSAARACGSLAKGLKL